MHHHVDAVSCVFLASSCPSFTSHQTDHSTLLWTSINIINQLKFESFKSAFVWCCQQQMGLLSPCAQDLSVMNDEFLCPLANKRRMANISYFLLKPNHLDIQFSHYTVSASSCYICRKRFFFEQTVGLLMSKSMCGCGCSIISSLMKRLGRTACCSDLFSSHTSEQLHRLATGCPPQPKVTMRQRPLTHTSVSTRLTDPAQLYAFSGLSPRVQCRKHMGPDSILQKAPRVKKLALLATHQHVENSESTQVKHTLTEVPHVESRHGAKNAKPFSSSDSLAKVQEVASWLLEMNQDLLSGGSSSRRSRGPAGPAVRGNASSTARAPQQAAEEGDEDEHINRVVEEEEQLQQRPEASQVDGEREPPWAPSESGASNGPRGDEEGEEDEEGPPNEVNGGEKGARWMWGAEQRRLRGQPLGEEDEEEEEEEEENNNSSSQHEEEEAEERTEGGEEQGREEEEREEGEEEEEEDEDEEEMDQDSDDFEHSESGREEEEEEEGEGEEGLRSPSLRNNVSVPNNNLDSGCTHQSSSNKKVSTAVVCWTLCKRFSKASRDDRDTVSLKIFDAPPPI
ncbi:hypothetical protein D9C73_002457 [Collichthys lucidus]|uniref:Uncharacterized protein n=1 Tax=Collichthys lucidus TaxID=240159 RepID=A0A4U5U642_COLLU|nr:hypothetical protein D9C73_002457 [Collichthys lucidus]